ncbi:thioesterase family protein [Staphylococcus sp. NAM3COL9]|uniref:thioesterase family protein n=1 Tax=Staphylococcus sp. NAM3COL9 TaxID=1667172 RepID=UPI00070C8ABF|nr:thioesterase family protein [Staphylococcus sp. NAM3COL9]KRG08184.1 3-hydroxyacyl-CoA dehydrogenase [Staphylococcus sp. NAM3COL9]
MKKLFTVVQTVAKEMIDHNEHVHDANYNMVFSDAINQFNYQHGLSLEEREALNYTMFTVEEQTAYLSELIEDDQFHINIYIYNYDVKRVHFFSIMKQQDGTTVATNEAMMLGVSRVTKKSAPFPQHYLEQIVSYYDNQERIDWPKQLGHRIDIPQ